MHITQHEQSIVHAHATANDCFHMKVKGTYYVFLIFSILVLVNGQVIGQTVKSVEYKALDDTTNLAIHLVYPENYHSKREWPIIIFYHGGGWTGGTWKQFLPQARYFSNLGFMVALPEYRLKETHGSTPFESLQDAKSAFRFLRVRAGDFNIDTTRIILSGGSAGGHLAAALTLVDGFNDPNDNMFVSTKGNLLVLFNPVLDNGPGGYGYERIGDAYRQFSPFHQPKDGTPPTLILLGTDDDLIPVSRMEDFCSQLQSADITCRLKIYDGVSHGFFNKEPYLNRTILDMEQFLSDHGFID